MEDFLAKVREMKKAHDNARSISLKTLKEMFPEWDDLHDHKSTLCQVLTSGMFKGKAEKSDQAQIDISYLIVFGILFCSGTLEFKAKHYLQLSRE